MNIGKTRKPFRGSFYMERDAIHDGIAAMFKADVGKRLR